MTNRLCELCEEIPVMVGSKYCPECDEFLQEEVIDNEESTD